VCFLDVSSEEAAKRGGFGDERYERKEFQEKVRINYDRLMDGDPTWKRINTDGLTLDQVSFSGPFVLGANQDDPDWQISTNWMIV
jgi:thymidylate kinase